MHSLRFKESLQFGGSKDFHRTAIERPLCSRQRKQPPLTFRGEAEAREQILMSQLRKIDEQLWLSAAGGKISQHFTHGYARAADARLAESNLRVDTDTIQVLHAPTLSRNGCIRQCLFAAIRR